MFFKGSVKTMEFILPCFGTVVLQLTCNLFHLCMFSTSSCVLKWEDPHDSVVYCVDSDNKWMVISGTNRYGVVSYNTVQWVGKTSQLGDVYLILVQLSCRYNKFIPVSSFGHQSKTSIWFESYQCAFTTAAILFSFWYGFS